MRKGISKAESRKALAIGEHMVRIGAVRDEHRRERRVATMPGYLGEGAYNVVCAISRDLVVRVQKEFNGWDDNSWELYEAAQVFPHVNMPTVWEIGRLSDGRMYAIVERMACAMRQSSTWGDADVLAAERAVVAHLKKHREVSELGDLHPENLMERRGSRELVITDCYIHRSVRGARHA